MAISVGAKVDVDIEAQVAHDMRDSLAALRLLVEAVRDGVLVAAPGSGTVDQMVLHVRLLEALLNAQCDGRERRHGSAGVQMVHVATLLEEWMEAMRLRARQRDVDLRLAVDDGLPWVPCRVDEISRVLLSLISGAIRRTPAGGSVRVRAAAHPSGVLVQVDDSGPGLGRDVRAILDGVPTTAPGTGAEPGLAVARQIVRAHGGALWAGTPPRGASVRFCLPAVTTATAGTVRHQPG